MSKRETVIKMVVACSALFAAAGSAMGDATQYRAYKFDGAATIDLFGEAGGLAVFNGQQPNSEVVSADVGGSVLLDTGASRSGSFDMTEIKMVMQGGAIFVVGADHPAVEIYSPMILMDGQGEGQVYGHDMADLVPYFDLPMSLRTTVMNPAGQMTLVNGMTISTQLAELLGAPQAAGQLIGQLSINIEDREEQGTLHDGDAVLPANGQGSDGEAVERVCVNPTTGPDVIVGDLNGISNYGVVGSIRAYSIGTTSCNLGNINLQWFSGNNHHPVIPQSLYRYDANAAGPGASRIRQIGRSFLKHAFAALSETLCCPSCNGVPAQDHLGTGCSDPYTSGRNGTQSIIGPSWAINATNGYYPYPFSAPTAAATIGRRLQVQTSEYSTAGSQLYFGECQYVSQDESRYPSSASGGTPTTSSTNDNNNISHRRLTISTSGTPSFSAATVRQQPAIMEWQTNDATVGIATLDSNPGGVHDGRFLVGYDATDLGGGTWHYEYAILNINSGRGGKAFEIPLPDGASVSNTGFYSVAYHSGDGIGLVSRSHTDWAATVSANSVRWSTEDCSVNNNANALMWGTMYNFWFDCNLPPAKLSATLDLWRGLYTGTTGYGSAPGGTECGTGAPGSLTVSITTPAADCNENNIADVADIATGTSDDDNGNGVPDECELPPVCPGDADGDQAVGLSDIAVVVQNWGQTVPVGTLGDLDGDGTVGLGDIAMVVQNWGNVCP